MKTKIALLNQTPIDMCLQEMGAVEALFDFLNANKLNDLNTNLICGKKYIIPNSSNVNTVIQLQYSKQNIKITTGYGNSGRLTEEGEVRLTEDGGVRITEGLND